MAPFWDDPMGSEEGWPLPLDSLPRKRHEVKRRRSSFEEGKLTQKEVNWNMTVEGLKNEIVGSYGVSFEDIVEQVVIIHPTIDFSKLNSYNVVVDGRIVRNL